MKPLDAGSLRHFLPEQDLMLLGSTPVCYHCHHFNLFLDQTIDDSLGAERGADLRFAAAREASYALLTELGDKAGAVSAIDKLELAAAVFRSMGHGVLEVSGDAAGGSATGRFLHYGHAWNEKYGQLVNRSEPVDAVAAGFAAAALATAHNLAPDRLEAEESACVALRATEGAFSIGPANRPETPRAKVEVEALRRSVQPTFTGQSESDIVAITNGLRDLTAGVAGDERGLVQAFGVYVTMHLTNYYNRISYDALDVMQKEAPGAVGVFESLLRESGHVCVFNTFGGILLSPEWEGAVGPLRNDPAMIVRGCLAIGRALGFGHWTLQELEPGRRLVVRSPSTYEASYYLTRHGRSDHAREYFLQGAALAIAQLAHRVDWESKPMLTQRFYNDLFRGGLPWRVQQTHNLVAGDAFSEVVVTHRDA